MDHAHILQHVWMLQELSSRPIANKTVQKESAVYNVIAARDEALPRLASQDAFLLV